jgi:hypothetical protein
MPRGSRIAASAASTLPILYSFLLLGSIRQTLTAGLYVIDTTHDQAWKKNRECNNLSKVGGDALDGTLFEGCIALLSISSAYKPRSFFYTKWALTRLKRPSCIQEAILLPLCHDHYFCGGCRG